MKKIKVSIGGDGKIAIKLNKVSSTDYSRMEFSAPIGAFLLSSSIINQMEIRVESIFRPGQPDVEIVYALSGSNERFPDMLHKFSSIEVVMHATQNRVATSIEKMAEHILKERMEPPKIIVAVHTHPENIAELSGQDKTNMIPIAKIFQKIIPGTKVIFAVHSVSKEMPRARTQIVKTAGNGIKWGSITRVHEVTFFNENSEPIEVAI